MFGVEMSVVGTFIQTRRLASRCTIQLRLQEEVLSKRRGGIVDPRAVAWKARRSRAVSQPGEDQDDATRLGTYRMDPKIFKYLRCGWMCIRFPRSGPDLGHMDPKSGARPSSARTAPLLIGVVLPPPLQTRPVRVVKEGGWAVTRRSCDPVASSDHCGLPHTASLPGLGRHPPHPTTPGPG